MDNPMLTIVLILAAVCVVLLAAVLVLLRRLGGGGAQQALLREQAALRQALADSQSALRQELSQTVQSSVSSLGNLLGTGQQRAAEQSERRFQTFEAGNEQKLEAIRETMERRLSQLQADNNEKLDQMRVVVDEKLQKTLESKMTQSFQLVSERLEQVYKGLGEMQTLATGVGDLKRVLSGVKTRGILGEIQLGAILEEIMAPEQYLRNVATAKNSRNPVEYAIKLPAEDGGSVLLPIDSKFPMDAYAALCDAYESGSPEAVRAAQNELRSRVRGFAKDIRDKYVAPPETTEFAVMFLPTEGLYAEVVKLGMIETLQRDFRVNIAGPSTMAALLNSLQMGFRSVAIQKRSGEVWKVLGAVKTEFEKFNDVLLKTQEKLTRAHDDLDRLIGVRTRGIRRSLREVTALPQQDAAALLPALGTDDAPEDSPYGDGE